MIQAPIVVDAAPRGLDEIVDASLRSELEALGQLHPSSLELSSWRRRP